MSVRLLSEMPHGSGGGDRVEMTHSERGGQVVGDLALRSTIHAGEDRSVLLDGRTLGVAWGKVPMDSVGAIRHDRTMEILTNVGAMVTGLVTVVAGLFSLASILFDDII